MTATQTQIRRDTAAVLNTVTPASSELAHDTTNKRIRIGDGSTLGGIILPNSIDVQRNSFNAGTVGGTANDITITLSPVPSAYASYFSVRFIATATNTGAATLNVNALGVKNLRKISEGAISDLIAGDIISGGSYEAVYDGTQFQLTGASPNNSAGVSQGDLNTSVGYIFHTGNAAWNNIALPGGSFGFYPRIRAITGTLSAELGNAFAGTSFSANIALNASSGADIQVDQTYITSSPPFDLGDGEVGGFIYALVDTSGKIMSLYAADVPPWAYNGETKTKCDYLCPVTFKKFRRVYKNSLEMIVNGSPLKMEMQEITHEIKNADMNAIPHPFLSIPEGQKVVLLDPMDVKVSRIIEYQKQGGGYELSEKIKGGFIKIDNDPIIRRAPDGVPVHKFKFKSKGDK